MGRQMMYLKKKINKFNLKTGEQESTTTITGYKSKKATSSYFKVFDSFINNLNSINITKKELLVLLELGILMSFNNEVIIDNSTYENIEAKLKMNKKTIRNYVYSLVKKNYMIRLLQNRYMINPYLLGKGDDVAMENLKYNYDSAKGLVGD